MLYTFKEAAVCSGWKNEAFQGFLDRVSGEDFPCIFARNAINRKISIHLFIESIEPESLDAVYRDIFRYAIDSTSWDGQLKSASPLILHFNHSAYTPHDTESDSHFGWRFLGAIKKLDEHSNQSLHFSTLIEDNQWTYSLGNVELFVNMSSPHFRNRLSRNLGPYFTMVINPRERFDKVAGANAQGKRARKLIRKRIQAYDLLPPSADLDFYEEGSYEWKQYALRDDEEPRTGSCPYSSSFKKGITS